MANIPFSWELQGIENPFFFRTPYISDVREWDAKQGKFNDNAVDYLIKNRLLLKIQDKATTIITQLEQDKTYYTLDDVERALRTESIPKASWFTRSGQKMAGRTGNACIHSKVVTSLKKFSGHKELAFDHITPEFLEKYEAWLRSNGGTGGGIGVKMRSIRAIFNTAIKRGRIKEELYPFKVYKVSKLKSNGIKKTLKLEEVHKQCHLLV